MKIILITFTFIAQVYAQTYLDFDSYIHSIKVELPHDKNLEQILGEYGYDHKKKNWVKITMLMNGLSEEILSKREESISIFLPPKISYQDYLNSKTNRDPASGKAICNPISRGYIQERFGVEVIPYIRYFDLITSRKIEVKPGDDILKIIDQDQFAYGSPEFGAKLTRLANGLDDNFVKTEMTIYLPFCVNEDFSKLAGRDIASLTADMTQLAINTERPLVQRIENAFSISYGAIDVQSSSSTMSMGVTKIGASSNYSLNTGFELEGYAAGVAFMNVQHSEALGTGSFDAIYPELSISLGQNFSKWGIGIAYSLQNYIAAEQKGEVVALKPIEIHSTSASLSFFNGDDFEIKASAGYLKSFDSINMKGTDYSIGAIYDFGRKKKYSASLSYYMASVIGDKGSNESSSGIIGSLSFSF